LNNQKNFVMDILLRCFVVVVYNEVIIVQ